MPRAGENAIRSGSAPAIMFLAKLTKREAVHSSNDDRRPWLELGDLKQVRSKGNCRGSGRHYPNPRQAIERALEDLLATGPGRLGGPLRFADQEVWTTHLAKLTDLQPN